MILCSDLTENGKRLLYMDYMSGIMFSDPFFSLVCQLDVTVLVLDPTDRQKLLESAPTIRGEGSGCLVQHSTYSIGLPS